MIRPGQEGTRLADRRAGESSSCVNDPGSSSHLVSFGIHGATPAAAAATNFFDQEGAAYFGELEEALMHGVDGIRKTEEEKSYFTARPPPTLEIFPSWPMRLQQNPRQGNSQSAGSTDSSSAHHTISQMESDSPASKKATSDQSSDKKQQQQQQQQQQMMMMAGAGASRSGTTTNHQLTAQEKKKMAGSTAAKDGKILDAKTLRRLAQNREAARKSRLRKKAYVQNLETSRIRLQQLEQELQRARSQGLFLGAGGNAGGAVSSAAATFDMEYSRWLEDDCKHVGDLRGALHAHLPDGNLGVLVDECIRNYDELFQLKGVMAKTDVFHLLSGMWTTPAERCFLWMGGFRPSELLKILMPQLDPLTEQQLSEVCGLQQSSHQAEEALSQGLEQLYLSLAKEVATGSLTDAVDVSNYMAHMAVALGKLTDLERFVREADRLRQVTLHQLRRILTIRQAARCFLAIGEYYTRLRALSSLWASRPRENMISNDGACLTPADLQMIHQPSLQNHFTAF